MPLRGRTIGLIRRLRAAGALPTARARVGRWPRPQQPEQIAGAYGDALVRLVAIPAMAEGQAIRAELLALVRDEWETHQHGAPLGILPLLPPQSRSENRKDAAGGWRGRIAQQVVDRAAHALARKMRPHELHAVARVVADRTAAHSRDQLDAQLRSAIGIPYTSLERPIRDLVPVFATSNVEIVRSVPDRYFERLRKDVVEAIEQGTHPDELAQRFVDLDGMAERDAQRLARDQVLKLHSNITHERMASLGVRRAIWRTMRDNRVCELCYKRQGREFDLDEGIDGCRPGECHPEDRCYPEPILDFMLAAA